MSDPTKCQFCGSELHARNDSFYRWECGAIAPNCGSDSIRTIRCHEIEGDALKARIARMEEAGDKLETCAKYACTDELVKATVDEWRKAKL